LFWPVQGMEGRGVPEEARKRSAAHGETWDGLGSYSPSAGRTRRWQNVSSGCKKRPARYFASTDDRERLRRQAPGVRAASNFPGFCQERCEPALLADQPSHCQPGRRRRWGIPPFSVCRHLASMRVSQGMALRKSCMPQSLGGKK